MKKIFATLLFIASVYITEAQESMPIHDPLTYRAINTEKYSGVKGSPFVFETEMKGVVTTDKGSYQVENMKYNCYDNIVQYTKNEEVFEITDPILHFEFFSKPSDATPSIKFEKGFSGNGIKPDQFARVFTQGKIKFIRLDAKSLTDMNEINVGVVKTFADVTKWYLVKDGSVSLVKLNKSEITALLSDQADAVQQYINAQSLNLKKEEDCVKLINYYNTL
jgi:hypothetical protein